MNRQDYQPGRQDKRAVPFNIRYSVRALHNLEKLVRRIEENAVLSVVSATVDYKKDKYILVVDTVWAGSQFLAYRYFWSKQKLTIVAGWEVIEEKTLKL